MTDKLSVGQLYPHRISPVVPKKTDAAPTSQPNAGKSFQEVFQNQVLRFSHHAEVRLQQRGIQLKPDQMVKIETAIDQAAAKGAKDALILMNDMALIVNVKNRTIVTAMDGGSMKDNVFTQIDSAVIIS
jgi:flagellar operon protein